MNSNSRNTVRSNNKVGVSAAKNYKSKAKMLLLMWLLDACCQWEV